MNYTLKGSFKEYVGVVRVYWVLIVILSIIGAISLWANPAYFGLLRQRHLTACLRSAIADLNAFGISQTYKQLNAIQKHHHHKTTHLVFLCATDLPTDSTALIISTARVGLCSFPAAVTAFSLSIVPPKAFAPKNRASLSTSKSCVSHDLFAQILPLSLAVRRT